MRASRGPEPPVWSIGPVIARDDVPELCARLAELARIHGPGPVICDVASIADPDITTIEALARLQLTARGLGCTIEIRCPRPRLRELLVFVGLAAVLPLSCLPVEPGRQAEEREQALGVEEVVDPGDPPA